MGLALIFPMLTYYASRMPSAQVAAVSTSPGMILACTVAVVVVTAAYLMWSAFPNSSLSTKGVAVLSIFTLVVGFGFIARLRVGAAAFQARELASPRPQFLYRDRFHVRSLELDLESPDVV